jgi:hypothetical protein
VDIAGESHVRDARASARRSEPLFAIPIVVFATHPAGNNRPVLENLLTGFTDDPQDAITNSTYCGIYRRPAIQRAADSLNKLWETKRRHMKH